MIESIDRSIGLFRRGLYLGGDPFTDHTLYRPRRRDAGGGGGKPSYKEREKSRRDTSSLPLPMPPADEGEEGGEGNKPENWPEKVRMGGWMVFGGRIYFYMYMYVYTTP